ncbi:magnesium transporter [Faecalibacterium wellingii]|uniref:Magnesium transporter MgtE n=1 Tax=Faecalibacterium wellingii TaxID=2929491 RepID=A0ABU3U1F8_9FIRM|nr:MULTISPECIES: magnesium transporter [Faecalibacterium]MDU8689340.1 magnesium transporter [Faecalibacterium prausnitzii]UQK57072.1 magnesium transporter [Faecalibacterium sp. HTF-F]
MSEISIDTLKTMLANLDDAKKYQSLRDVMETLPAPDLAAVFEDLPAEKLPVLFRLCPKDLAADVFAELTPATQQQLIDGLTDTELKAVVDELFMDDATDLVEEMPANVVKRILAQADPATRRMINELLKYPEDSAGGVMTTELMALRPDMTVAQAMDTIRENGFDKETINNCYVTDSSRRLVGVVSLRALVLAKNTEEPIKDLMDSKVVSVSTTTDQEDVSKLFEKYGFLAIPVVDAENRLVGIVTIDDAISILQDEASEDIAKMNAIGPSDKPYFKQSMWDLYKSRAPWLLFLMISATFSSLVIRGYEDALAAVTVLTAYIPMLTDAGGNAGSQSTSTIIRGMAVGDIQPHDLPRILWRESRVALLCGGTLAVCNFAKMLLFDRIAAPVALVVCLTLICTILLSQIIGGILPVAAEKLHVDPAVMASPLITTIVDTTTLLVYFNIAKALLHL